MTRYLKGGRQSINLRFDPELVAKLDALAEGLGNKNRTELLEEGAKLVLKHYEDKQAKGGKKGGSKP